MAELGFTLRKEGRGTKRASVELGYTDGMRSFGTARITRVIVRDDEIATLATAALEAARKRRVRIRRLELRLSEIESAGPELDLFEPKEVKLTKLQTALDKIHGRFGLAAIESCSALL